MNPNTPTRLLLTLPWLLCAAAQAQSQGGSPEAAQGGARGGDSRIERLRVEDDSVRVDETRVRGETQSITVTPKSKLPAYEVMPATANRPPSTGARDNSASTGGARVWKVFGF